MAKKPLKKAQRTPAQKRREASPPPSPPAITTAPAPSTATPPPPPAPMLRSRPVARYRRATASPAQRRGADLVRFLRIHLKHPYGDRGIQAIETLAREVAHLANLELNAREAK